MFPEMISSARWTAQHYKQICSLLWRIKCIAAKLFFKLALQFGSQNTVQMRFFCCCCCFYRQTSNYFVFAWIFVFYLARSFSTSTCSAFVLLPFFVTIRTCFTHKKSDTFGVCICSVYDTPFICVLLFLTASSQKYTHDRIQLA